MNKKLVLAALILVVAISFMLTYKNQNTTGELKTIKVAINTDDYITDTLITLADEKGYLKENGLKVEKYTNTAKLNEALSAGEVDVANVSTTTSLLNYLNDRDTVFVDKLSTRPPLHGLVAKKGVLAKLDKCYLQRIGSAAQMYSEIVKGNVGINNMIKYQTAPTGPATLAAIEKDQNAFGLVYVYGSEVQDYLSKGDFQIIQPEELWKDKKAPMGLVTTNKLLGQKGSTIKNFVKAINASQSYAINHPDEYKNFIVKQLSLQDKTAESIKNAFLLTASKDHKLYKEDLNDVLVPVKELEPTNPNKDVAGFINNNFVNSLF